MGTVSDDIERCDSTGKTEGDRRQLSPEQAAAAATVAEAKARGWKWRRTGTARRPSANADTWSPVRVKGRAWDCFWPVPVSGFGSWRRWC
jgi:hypothetical protein